MKSKFFIFAAMLLAMPSTMLAQQPNIQKAFDALLSDKITESKTRHVLDRDSKTGRMTALADVYDFTISSNSALERLNDVRKAFEKDKNEAYKIQSDNHADADPMDDSNVDGLMGTLQAIRKEMYPTTLVVGDGSYESVAIGSIKGSSYIYACFADKDDPDNKYRYAYAVEWAKRDKKTQVRLAVTYAMRPEARNGKTKKTNVSRVIVNGKEVTNESAPTGAGEGKVLNRVFINGKEYTASDFNSGNISDLIKESLNGVSAEVNVDSLMANRAKTPESWLSEFNTYKRLFLKNPDSATATHYATSIYSLCKKSAMLNPEEKKIVISELTKLKEKTTDELIQNVFVMSIKKLKE